jgi:AbrB family looped-hinge helix DNA binding protein
MVIRTASSNRHRARLTSQGQVTIPKPVRDAMGARPGDDLEFEPRGDSFIVRRRARRDVLDFAGIASRAASRIPRSAAELDKLLARTASDEATVQEERVRRQARRSR